MKIVYYTLFLIVFICFSGGYPAISQEQETQELLIETAEGEKHTFQVELARTASERAQGLMYRRSMDEDAGMLFIYPRAQHISMWMKNTFIPLDMLFINEDGNIIRIAERTVPHSTQSIPSGGRARAVLEINAGMSDRLGISEGDRVNHPAFE
ncbi:DUF192 domain-containing protein [Fodinicurvata sediminis]|uniref:DUF192 domain-containing protein n=1 Tax=Fodinicurvata sediminis TaxID=1121832 RepID=UPI0003B534FE|nr:DUF192 domain-containing protein [Fodinicurvata sediminis]